MSVFIRRYLSDPGNEVLLDIESVNILDLDPPASIAGIGTGTVIEVAEFENGPFAAGGNSSAFALAAKGVFEVAGATDFANQLGTIGYNYLGVPGNNPSAVGRKADGALVEENWNGHGAMQLNGKKFKRLLVARVDTSVGSVQLQRQAFVGGFAAFAYNLEPGQILQLDVGAGPQSATFTGVAATVTGVAGTFPTTFAGGETLTLGYDGAPNFVVTFLAADQSNAQVVARINSYAGFSFADINAGQIRFTSIQRGSGAQVRVVSGSAGVLAILGLTAATTLGTGNTSNIDAVKFAEIKTVVEAAVSGSLIEQDSSGALRASTVFVASGDYIAVGSATTAVALGFPVGRMSSNDGFARVRSTAGTYVLVPTATLVLGVDNEPNFNVALTAGMSLATVITTINTAAGFTMASTPSANILLLRGRANAGQVRVVTSSGAMLTALGLVVGTTVSTGVNVGSIPAGTLLQNTANDRQFVMMQDVDITVAAVGGVGGVGPYNVKVRHALDDGSGLSATAGTINKITNAPDLGSFQVVNPATLTAALTEAAIDAAYSAAIDTTLDLNTVARQANIIVAARQSNTVRRALRANALTASSIGMFGRMTCIRAPLGTLKGTATSNVLEPGVGAYRDQRVIYCYPGMNTFVPVVAQRGLGGGKGFTVDGNVDTGLDTMMASILSQIAPEENPGQLTSFTGGANGLDSSPNSQGFTIDDYIAFKAAGIAAGRVDDGTLIFQSGITSVDPSVYPNLKNIARRRMADFIQDTLAKRCKSFGKKLSTNLRRQAIGTEIRSFMDTLVSKNNPSSQRIDSYSLDTKSGNTATTLAQGLYRLILKVRTLASLDSIVLQTTIGESVVIDENLPAAA